MMDNEIFRRMKKIDPSWAQETLDDPTKLGYIQEMEQQRKIKKMMIVILREMPFLSVVRK